ncbi:MAG: discoidin domain-containing protein [Clostridia bacterium]|nr:discoidin domain-containing protein [Clostridia bacterium]
MKKLFSLVLSLCILAGCLCLPISAFAAAPALSSLEISVDGVTYESVEDFNAETLTYYYKCRGEVLPTVRATAASKDATVTVHQAGKYYRTAEIIVSEGGQDTTYEVVFLQNLSHLDGVTATANLGYQSNPASMAIDGVYTAASSWLYSTTATEKGVFNLDLGAVYDVYDISIVYNYNVGNDAENHDIIYSSTTGTEDADYGDPIGVTSTDKGEFNEVADAKNVDWFDLTLDKAIPFKARYFKLTGSAEKGAIGYSEVEVWGLGEQYPTALDDIKISEDGGATYTSFADYNPATNTYYYKCGRTADDSGNILPLVQAIAADGTTATVLQASEGIRNAKITVSNGTETSTYTIYFLINLSLETDVTAAATTTGWNANRPITTIDGDLTTYWSYASNSTKDSIWVDLGASYQVYEISALIFTAHATGGSTNVDELAIKNTAATAATDADWTKPTATFAQNTTNPPSGDRLEEYNHTLSALTTLRSVKISGSATTGARGIYELQIWGLPAQAADNDASLSNISLSTNGRTYENIADFDSEKDTYIHYCQDFSTFENGGNYPLTSNIPSVKAAASHRDARVAITQATAGDATATIVVTAPDGVTQKTYKVLMVSDVASTSTVTTGGSYSDHRAQPVIDRNITTYWQAGSAAGGYLLTIDFGAAKTITGFDFYVHKNSQSTTHWDVVTMDTDTSTDVPVTLSTISSTAVGSKYKVSGRFETPVTATKLKFKGSTTTSVGRFLYEAVVWGNSSRNAIYQDAEHNFNATLNWASAKSETGTLYWGWYDGQGNLLKIGKIANPVAVAPGTGQTTGNTSTNAAATGTNVTASLGKAPANAETIRFFFWNGDIQPVETTLWIGL